MNMGTIKYLLFILLLNINMPVISGTIDTTGQAPYEQCGYCHEYDGNSRMSSFPRIAGQKSAYIVKQLRDFRSGKRTGRMQATAELLNDDDIYVVAEYFSRQIISNRPSGKQSSSKNILARKIFFEGDSARGIQSCESCHGRYAEGVGNIPRLAGQHERYLYDQIVLFKSGVRNNDESGRMQNISRLLSNHEIQALVGFLANITVEK